MLISCPKCKAVYNITNQQIPKNGKRFKCVECGRIWTVYQDDVKNLEPEKSVVKSQMVNSTGSINNNDINEIFSRISRDTKNLFDNTIEKNDTKNFQKLKIIFSPYFLNFILITLITFLTIYICYYKRYEIVGSIPRLENIYNNLNIESLYNGRNIVFKNINTKSVRKDEKQYIEILGEIYNNGDITVKIPPIKIVVKNSNGIIENEEIKILPNNKLSSKFSTFFSISLLEKSKGKKFINLSFEQKK